MALTETDERARMTVTPKERTLVQQARRVEKAQARRDKAKQEYDAACSALLLEIKALETITGGAFETREYQPTLMETPV